MKSPIYGMLRVEFPLLALSHCPDVVSEMLRAGGMGALGAVSLPPERLEEELAWIDDHVGGKPYGIDLIVPNKIADQKQEFDAAKLIAAIPAGHKAFTKQILERHDIDVGDLDMTRRDYTHIAHNIRESGEKEALDVAFGHPFKLIANALGFPPQSMLEAGKRHGVAVAALVSAKEHAIRQVAAGVDILVIAGGEAVGHCGDVPTMVLIPEVREALAPHGDVPILAAGGFVTGRHMAASIGHGWGRGVDGISVVDDRGSRSQLGDEGGNAACELARHGALAQPHRQAVTAVAFALDRCVGGPRQPYPLPMPLQSILAGPLLARIDKPAECGHSGAADLATYWVGQGVGLMNHSRRVRFVMPEFQEDFVRAYERLSDAVSE